MVKSQTESFFKQHRMFILLLLIGLIFRFLFMYYQGLSNDELSAWKRTEFSNWNDFWQLGVKAGDMHPVFYQALLWCWVRTFGDSELAIRSTSLVFYFLNSWIIYKISIQFFSKQVGLAVIALYAGLAFTIIHTVFARPYNSGTFFLLLLVWSIFEIQRSTRKITAWHLGIILGFLGAMLSHYYAFLTAGVIGLLAMFYANRSRIKDVIACGFISILLFLPHWPVTKYQLNQGGLGWLSAPKRNWISEFFYQFLNYSWIIFGLFVLIFIYSLAKTNYFKSDEEKFVLRIFLVTYLTGHLISLFYTPVLRELVMLFTLPFLFIYLFRGFQFSTSKHFNRGLITIAIALGIHSIFALKLLKPKNFGVFREIGNVVNSYETELKQENMEFASNFNNLAYINYYYDKDVSEKIADWSNPETVYDLAQRARDSDKDYFVYNWSNHFHLPMYYEVVRKHFPYTLHHKAYFNSASTIFSKKKSVSKEMSKVSIKLKYENTFKPEIITKDEFIGGIYIPAKQLSDLKAEYFLVEAIGKIENDAPLFLVATLERAGQTLMNGENAVLYNAYNQSRLVEIDQPILFFNAFELPSEVSENDKIHIYFWNPDKQSVNISFPKIFQIPIVE